MMKSTVIVLFAVLVSVTPVLAKPAPKVTIASFAQLKTPLPYPYDEAANADKEVAAAKAKAKAQHKRLIVDMGGNWCPCLLYTSPSPRDRTRSRMPSSA